MTGIDDMTKGVTGILGAGLMLKATDMTLNMIGGAKPRRRRVKKRKRKYVY